MRQARVHRLLDPLEDVFNHVRFQRNRRPAMKILLLKEMLNRGRSLWGWTEDEWLETIKKSGGDRHFVTAVAYLLSELDGLQKLGRRNFVFFFLAYRGVWRERLFGTFSVGREKVSSLGYSKRVAVRYAPRR